MGLRINEPLHQQLGYVTYPAMDQLSNEHLVISGFRPTDHIFLRNLSTSLQCPAPRQPSSPILQFSCTRDTHLEGKHQLFANPRFLNL